MTEREKMIKIIDKWAERTITTRVWGAGVYDPYNAAELADALIAAGIGDVTEWKERAEKHRVIALPGGRIKQLYSDEEVEDIARQRDEYRKSTHIALRGIEILKRNILRYFATEFPSILQQAEREIEEEGKDG